MRRLITAVSLVAFAPACGSSSSSTAAPTPTAVNLTGAVTAGDVGAVSGATIKILDGTNANRTATTDSAGNYTFTGLTPGNANLSANASIYDEQRAGVFINGSNRLNFVFPFPPVDRTIQEHRIWRSVCNGKPNGHLGRRFDCQPYPRPKQRSDHRRGRSSAYVAVSDHRYESPRV